MAEKPDGNEAQDIGEIIVMARKRQMNFAAVIGKDSVAIASDPRKGPEVMWRLAKQQAGGTKGGKGTMTVVGNNMHLQFVDDDFPASLRKAMIKHLSQAGYKMKVIIRLADGSVVGGDDDEEDGQEGVNAASSETANDPASADTLDDAPAGPVIIGKKPDKRDLSEEFVEVRKNLMKGMVQLDGAGQAAVQKHIKQFGDLMKAKDLMAAQDLMDDLAAMMGAVTDPQRIRAREDVEQIDSMLGDIEAELDALDAALDGQEVAA